VTIYQEIPLDQIRPDPDQPRRVFDLESLAELADSIREHGVLQPIAVYPNGKGYIIKHGERRWRASKMANQKTVPVIIADAPDALTRKIQQFVENYQREPMNVIDTALFYQSMLDEGLSMMELSRKLGRGGQTTFITNALVWIHLENAPDVPLWQSHSLERGSGRLSRRQLD